MHSTRTPAYCIRSTEAITLRRPIRLGRQIFSHVLTRRLSTTYSLHRGSWIMASFCVGSGGRIKSLAFLSLRWGRLWLRFRFRRRPLPVPIHLFLMPSLSIRIHRLLSKVVGPCTSCTDSNQLLNDSILNGRLTKDECSPSQPVRIRLKAGDDVALIRNVPS